MVPKIKIYNDKYGNPKFSFVAIIVLTGSIFENNEEKGLSHFLEHLIFKGSKYSKNIKDLNNKLNGSGMIVNAFTSPFITCYHMSCPTIYIKDAINTLVQMVFNPLLRESDIENERLVVINELMQGQSTPEEMVQLKAQQLTYGKSNPLHHPIIGYIDVLKEMDREKILSYYHRFYSASNCIFFTFTGKDRKVVKNFWENAYKHYGSERNEDDTFNTFKIFKSLKPKLKIINKGGTFHISNQFPNNETIFVIITYIFKKCTDKQEGALVLFSTYLAGGLSSKLFTEMRDKKQLIYSVHAFVEKNIDSVSLNIQFSCKKDKKIYNDCISTITKVMNNFKKNGMEKEEFKKFKNKTLINYDRMSTSGMVKMNELVDKHLFGIEKSDFRGNVKSITLSYLNKNVGELLRDRGMKKFIFTI